MQMTFCSSLEGLGKLGYKNGLYCPYTMNPIYDAFTNRVFEAGGISESEQCVKEFILKIT